MGSIGWLLSAPMDAIGQLTNRRSMRFHRRSPHSIFTIAALSRCSNIPGSGFTYRATQGIRRDQLHDASRLIAGQRSVPERSLMLDGSLSNVSRAQSGMEAATFVETVYSWIFSAALKQDMVAAGRPSRRKRRLNHGSTVAFVLGRPGE